MTFLTFYSQVLFLLASNNPLDILHHLIFFHSHLYFNMRFWYFKSIPIQEFLKIMYLSWVFGFFFQCITVHRLRAQAAKLCTLPVGSWDIVSTAIKYKGHARKIKNQRTYWIMAFFMAWLRPWRPNIENPRKPKAERDHLPTGAIVWPRLWRITDMSLVVNK